MRSSAARIAATLAAAVALGGSIGCSQRVEPALPLIDVPDSTPFVPRPTDVGGADDVADQADTPQPLRAVSGEPVHAFVGDYVLLDGSASTGAVSYQWSFGNGDGWSEPRPGAAATAQYDTPGRYEAILTVFDERGEQDQTALWVTITHPRVFRPRPSSTIVALDDEHRFAVVSPESNELMIAQRDLGRWEVERRVPTDRGPRTVNQTDTWLVVPCATDATVLFFDRRNPQESRRVFLPAGSAPFGATTMGETTFVTLQATGQVARIEFDGPVPKVTATLDVIEDARGITALPDGRLLVSRWRSPDTGGEIAVVSPDFTSVQNWPLAVDPQNASDNRLAGLPSYLGAVAVSPTGLEAAVPSLQANHRRGEFLSGQPLEPDQMLRATVSFLDLEQEVGQYERRKQWGGRGFANAATYTRHGDYLWIAMRSNRAVERYDALTSTESGTIDEIGYTIEGLAVTADDRFLGVDASDSRELVVYEVESPQGAPVPLARLQIPTAEPLGPQVLRGKQLFNDAEDPRITSNGTIACAHCHLDGDGDRRVWDLTDRGEGLRNTVSLLGRGGGSGPLNWSARFDEVQDFEHTVRGAFGGTGLMSDEEFATGTRDEPLGDSKAGVSSDLDALAAYVSSLDRHLPSPHRAPNGALTAKAVAGEATFFALGCDNCHAPPRFTDSFFLAPGVPRLHDVGTLTAGSGNRLGAKLNGIDTPTLRGVWNTAPYLHDGSAPTLLDVLTTRNPADAHGATSGLSATQLDELVAYLRSLDHH